jgi:hypothetical protein
MEELGEDRSRVAFRAIQRRVGYEFQDAPGMMSVRPGQGGEDGLHRHRQIGSGVAVGYREDIDTVQPLLIRHDALDSGTQTADDALCVKVSDAGDSLCQEGTRLVWFEQESTATIFQDDALRHDLADHRAAFDAVALPVLAAADEHHAFLLVRVVDMQVQM